MIQFREILRNILQHYPIRLAELSGYEIPADFSVVFSGATDHGYYSLEKYLIEHRSRITTFP